MSEDNPPNEVLEIVEHGSRLMVRTLVDGEAVSETPVDMEAKAGERIRHLTLLADARLDKLLALENRKQALEALKHQVAQEKEALLADNARAEAAAREQRERVQKILDTLFCGICFDFLDDPFVLTPCGHTACARCILRWMNEQVSKNQQIVCTSCQTAVTRQPTPNVTARQAADAAMQFFNPQRLKAREEAVSASAEARGDFTEATTASAEATTASAEARTASAEATYASAEAVSASAEARGDFAEAANASAEAPYASAEARGDFTEATTASAEATTASAQATTASRRGTASQRRTAL
ncbi:hypothetical protein EV715DRAFT_297950 [Schizophyllum commune]